MTLNRSQKITAVFAGDLFLEHRAACEAAKRDAMQPVDAPFDVVLTTNSGFPLDQSRVAYLRYLRRERQQSYAGPCLGRRPR